MWQSHFDKILLINLPQRTDRLTAALNELARFGIQSEVMPAIHQENGAYGLFLTLLGVFKMAEAEGWGNILIFEDDVQFSVENLTQHLDTMVQELKYLDWDLFYLGGNVNAPLIRVPKCDYLLRCNMVLSTHAVAYSKQGWKLLLQEMCRISEKGAYSGEPIDMTLARIIQPQGRTYVSYPLLAVQRPGWSDVENRDTDYKIFIQDRYNERLKQVQ